MKYLIVANWKMNPESPLKAKLLFNSIKKGIKKIQPKKTKIVLAPPFVYLPLFGRSFENLSLCAQNCFWEQKGAFTGEISPLMLKNLGVEYVILGHSERRKYFQEKKIGQKMKACFKINLKPILCVGEKEKGKIQILKKQLDFLKKNSNFKSHFLLAYEPVWAIGTGKYCQPKKIKKIVQILREILAKINQDFRKIKILYGGSVNSQNAFSILKEGQIEGLLIGKASLKAKEFLKIVKIAEKIS